VADDIRPLLDKYGVRYHEREGWRCSVEGCTSTKRQSPDMCVKHHTRVRRHGDPEHGPGGRPWFEARLAAHVEVTGFCWQWVGSATTGGYGTVRVGGASVRAHRWVYEELVGPIPQGLVLDHLCRNPGCVNPDHLEPVTQKENVQRSLHCTRRWCPAGHDLHDPENTYPGKRRRCKPCTRKGNRESTERKRAGLPPRPGP
jgi:hypothetical protein